MKIIQFQGVGYNVPDDAKYITQDADGIYTWTEKPELDISTDCFLYREGGYLISNAVVPICEKLK